MPKGYEYQGVIICSDGVEPAIKNGEITKALKQLYDRKTNASPSDITHAIVTAAKPFNKDNITAMMLPNTQEVQAGATIAVADGNSGSAAVAEKALTKLKEKCTNINPRSQSGNLSR